MKKLTCLLLSLLLTLTVLTSCDVLTSILGGSENTTTASEVTTTEPEVTTTEPEVTTPEPEITTPEPEVTTPEPEVTTPEPEVTTTEPEVTTTEPEDIPVEPQINYGSFINPVTTTYAYTVCSNLEVGEFSMQPFYVKGTVTEIGTYGNYYKNVYFTDGETELLIYTINMPEGIDGFEVGDVITAFGYIKNYNGTIEMATYNVTEYVYVVRVEAGNPDQGEVTTPEVTTPEVTTPESEVTTPEPEIYYGTESTPVSVSDAYNACLESLEIGETSKAPFYVKGTVTAIGQFGSYYREVYFTDGTTEMLIYTINMPEGIDGFEVGDTIVACGYIKNYNGIIEMATNNASVENPIYVYVVSVESAGGDQDNTSEHLYTDFTDEEKELFNDYFGFVIPFIANSDYSVEEYYEDGVTYISFYTFGNTQAEFDAYLSLFSSYQFDGTDTDEYGDTWYMYSQDNVFIDIAYYSYEGNYIVDVYVYILVEDDDVTDPVEPEINYGTINNPVTTTDAYNACADLANGESSAEAFYVRGTVTAIGQFGSYYREVYFTDGTTEMLIYTINMPEGIDGFEVGDTIVACGYIKNYNGIIEMATYNGSVYVYVVAVESENNNQGGTDTSDHLYTDFTADEKALFNDYFGFVIPFISNSEYSVEEYEEWGEIGISFYTVGNTQAEFAAYRSLFSSYSYDGSEEDEYGDMWYFYSKGNVYVDMSFYYYEGDYVVDVYIYISDENSGDDDWGDTEEDLITNEGKGLPEDNDGIYDVDFTKGQYVQNVTDQGYYIDGCPTTGNPAVLVIPVEFKDITAQSKGYSIQNIEKIFTGTDLPYYSVYDYFLTSSYNQLSLNITVLDSWFCPKNNSSYYESATYDYYGEEIAIGDQLIMDEALAYLATVMDLSQFDSDNNGIIDAIVMVNTLEIGEDDFHWAYRYWNLYTDDEEYYYEYDGVSANDYVWIAYDFMFEAYDENGNTNHDPSNPLNPYTFIHEFSHILGVDDYYDTAYQEHPLGGLDMMDDMMGDHNPYTKFNLGWITSSKLIVTNGTVTVNLEAFAKNGDTIILANNWDETLGAYQEYYVIMYYTMTGLNAGDGGFFARNGIVVYHINASLYTEQYGDETYYGVYNTNTSSGDYGTKDNLIEFVKSGEGNYTYTVGDTLPTTTDDSGNELIYTFIVDAITDEYATITFTIK